MDGPYYDSLETRDPEEREKALMRRLPGQIAHAKAGAAGWAEHLDEVEADEITSREALSGLPVLRKPELMRRQAAKPPLGGLNVTPISTINRLYVSPGPVYEAEGGGKDYWRVARALYAAGVRSGDIVHNCFAFNFTPGGWMLDSGIRALGCPAIAGGVGNTEMQVTTISHYRPTVYAGTPDFLKVILDKAEEMGVRIDTISRALVSGGALFPSLRDEYVARGVAVLQCYITADVGLIAYESDAIDGMIIEEDIIVEIVRPGSNDLVEPGEVGEVVVTTFNRDCPMIRFGTGDLSAVLPGPSPCGRTNMRIKGWMGRADQRTKVKGMFIDPEQVNDIAARHPELGRLRLVVTRQSEIDTLTLYAECDNPAEGLSARIGQSLQAIAKLNGEVEIVAPGSLANDGKVIADDRDYD